MSRVALGVTALALAAVLAACGVGPDSPVPGPATPSGAGPTAERQALAVFAASSLTDAFGDIEEDFESAHPGVDVVFNFAGSADLATQINEGAPADVFASANEAQMTAVAESVPDPQLFASNTLMIAVATGNPLGITSLEDLEKFDLKLVVCAPVVPCGAATATLAGEQGVRLTPVSEEGNVTDVLGKVASGEADAGIVYVTDMVRASDVEGVAIRGSDSVVNRYPIGVVADREQVDAAGAFVSWVLGAAGQTVLAEHGFGTP